MCGRLTQDVDGDDLADLYGLDEDQLLALPRQRWNGCPTQDFAICRLGPDQRQAIGIHRWGLVPSWARDLKIGPRLINARAETVDSKPSFRAAFARRRCLIPANGWFEWRRTGTGKQPWWISMQESPFSFAGLWEVWDRGLGSVPTFTILTCPAARSMEWLHHRQPVIVPRSEYQAWLSPSSEPRELLNMVRAPEEGPFEFRRVDRRVNSPKNDSLDLLDPV